MISVGFNTLAWPLLASVHANTRWRTRFVASRRTLAGTGARTRTRIAGWTVLSILSLLRVVVETCWRKLWLEVGGKALRRRRSEWHVVWHVRRASARIERRKWHTPSARRHHTTLAWRSAEGRRWHPYIGQTESSRNKNSHLTRKAHGHETWSTTRLLQHGIWLSFCGIRIRDRVND